MARVEHLIEVYNRDDELLGEIDRFTSIQYQEHLNQPTSFSFGMDLSDPKATPEMLAGGQNYIKYYRGDSLRWSGEMYKINGELAKDDRPFTVECHDKVYGLKDRWITTEEIWTSTNEGQILIDIIDYLQVQTDGHMGINTTDGVNLSTDLRDRTYFDKKVLEVFTEFSSLQNGVDFEITPSGILNIYDKKGSDRTATHVFRYADNIDSMSYIQSWDEIKNDLKLYGADARVRPRDNGASQGIYRRRQDILSYPDAYLDATLDRLGDEIMQTNAVPIRTFDLNVLPFTEPPFGTYQIGDKVQLTIENNKFLNINQAVRIYGWNVIINNDGYETISLTVSTKL